MSINDIVIAGNVVSDPRISITARGDAKTVFRIAHNRRYLNRGTGEWVEGETTYLDVACWRQLAENVLASVQKGMPVVVTGRLEVRQVPPPGGEGPSRTFVTVEAAAVGHDLAWGQARFERIKRTGVVEQEGRALADAQDAA